MMREDYHPWYIGYTSPLVVLAIMFYQPANLLTRLILGHEPTMLEFHVSAFLQSALLSSVLLSCWLLKAHSPKLISSEPSQNKDTKETRNQVTDG